MTWNSGTAVAVRELDFVARRDCRSGWKRSPPDFGSQLIGCGKSSTGWSVQFIHVCKDCYAARDESCRQPQITAQPVLQDDRPRCQTSTSC